MRGRWPKVARILVWVFGLAAVLGAVFLFLIHQDASQRWVLVQAQRAAEKSGLILKVGDFSYNLLHRRLELGDVELSAKGHTPPFAKATRVSVSWQYRNLRRGLAAIEDLRVEDVTIDIRRLSDGTLNLPQSDGDSAPIEGLPHRAEIRALAFRYSDPEVQVSFPRVDLDYAGGKWHGEIKAPGTVTNPQISGVIDKLQVAGTLQKLALEEVSATGTASLRDVRIATEPPLSAQASFSLDGAAMRFDLKETHAQSVRGSLDGEMSLSLRGESSRAKATMDYEGIRASMESSWPGLDFPAIRATASVESRREDVQGRARVTLTSRQVDAAVLSATAAGAVATGNVRLLLPSLRLSGKLTGNVPSLGEISDDSILGSAAFSADLSGTAKDPQVALNISTDDAGAGPVRDARVRLHASYRARRIEVDDAFLSWNNQEATAIGSIDLHGKDAGLDFQVTAENWSADSIAHLFNPDLPVDGRFSISAAVGGTVSQPETQVLLQGTDLLAWGEHLGRLEAEIETDGQLIRLRRLRLDKPQASGPAEVASHGWLNLETRNYEVELATTNLHLESVRLPEGEPLQAAIDLKASGAGSLDNPGGAAELKVASAHLGDLQAHVALSGQELSVTNASGTVRFDRFGVPGSTKFAARGRLPWNAPHAAEGEATMTEAAATIASHKIVADGPIALTLRNDVITVAESRIRSDDGTLTVSGSLPISRPSQSDQLTLQGTVPLALAARHVPDDLKVRLQGNAAIQGTIRGTAISPIPDVLISTTGASVASENFRPTLDAIDARAHVTTDRIEVEHVQAQVAGGMIHGSGSIPLGPGETRVTLDAQKLDLSAVAAPEGKLKSSISVHIDARSPTWNLEDVVATARFSELSLSNPKTSLSQSEETVLSLAKGIVDLDAMKLSNRFGQLQAGGTVALMADQALNLRLDGKFETDILSEASTAYGLSGPLEAHIAVGGTIPDPQFRGDAEMKGGRLVLAEPLALAADQIELRLAFQGRTIQIERASGSLNGGTFDGGGSLSLDRGTISTADLKLKGEDVFLNYPRGFQSASDFDLTLKNQGRSLLLGGTATVLDSSYRQPLNIAGVAASKLRQLSMIDSPPNELVSRLRFDVAIKTDQPVVFDNNLGRVHAFADLRLGGSVARPALTGRFEIEEGGRVYFGGRTFTVSEGIVDFTDETRIAPRFNLEADSKIGEYEVSMKLTGDLDKTETTFRSDPSLSEDEILSLLMTGSKDNAGKGSSYAQSQMLSLFGSGITGGLTTRLRNTVGLSEFRIDPGLVSADKNPTARLTIGQSFTPEFRITYSTNLTDSQDQIWTAEYDWRRRFLARFFRETNQSNRMELRQKFRFGGGALTGATTLRESRPKLHIGTIEIEGTPVFEEKTILGKLKLKPGRKYDFLKAQQGLERLKAYYAKNGYAEARIHQGRQTNSGKVDLTYNIDAGKPVKFVFEGADASSSLKRDTARTWQQGIIDPQRIGTAVSVIRRHFIRKGYADAATEGSVRDLDDSRTVVFEIERGPNYGRPLLSFPGAPANVNKELNSLLRRSKLDMEVKSNPAAVVDAVSSHLRSQGFLAVKVSQPRTEVAGKQLAVAIPVETGREFHIGTIGFQGAYSLQEDVLALMMMAKAGDKYVPDDRYVFAQRVQQAYWNAGYRKADVVLEESLDAADGKANLTMKIEEGQKFKIAEIQTEGLSETSEEYVRKRLTLTEGDVLNAKEINQSRKNLLDSGAYNRLDITYPDAVSQPSSSLDHPVNLLVAVREPKPFRIDIGGSYDTDRGVGVIADISTVNKLGEARTLGFRTTDDRFKQDQRIYFTQPFLGRQKINTTATLFGTNERQVNSTVRTLDIGASLQQTVKFHTHWTFSYGYQWESSYLDIPDFWSFKAKTSAMISTLVYDSRDIKLDATKGNFISGAVEYGPGILGGNLNYYRAYLQASKYIGLSKPGVMPFESGQRRSRFVFASSARVGFIDALGNSCPEIPVINLCVLATDGFYAGGGTTIRGYAQNSVGPQLFGSAIGGQATFILNNEFRFPLFKMLDGVAFVDTGNVWARPSNFNITDVRTGTGFGVRVRNPFILLRFDYGWKVGRRPGESAGAFFFSIGQAF